VSQRASQGRAAFGLVTDEKVLAEALADIAGERALASTKSVGRVLKFREGRIVSGLRLTSKPGRSGREYRINVVEETERRGFAGFRGFESGHSETDSSTEANSEGAKSNPRNPANPQNVDADGPEDW